MKLTYGLFKVSFFVISALCLINEAPWQAAGFFMLSYGALLSQLTVGTSEKQ